jgi:hypothetical protein
VLMPDLDGFGVIENVEPSTGLHLGSRMVAAGARYCPARQERLTPVTPSRVFDRR